MVLGDLGSVIDFINQTGSSGGINATDILEKELENVNVTDFFGTSLPEIEHFLGDPDVLHIAFVGLGLVALLFSKRFPQVLGLVAAICIGLWVALVVQEKQVFVGSSFAGIEVPQGSWVPLVVGLLAAAAAGIVAYFTWRIALGAITYGVLAMLFIAICRLFNMSPEQVLRKSNEAISAHPMAGAIALVIAIFLAVFLIRKCHKAMASFVSAHIGMLLLLSGLSYFMQKASGEEAPFSLMQDLARIWSQVRHGRCHIFDNVSESTNLQGCDCGEHCRGDIAAWILGSWVVLVLRYWSTKCEERRKLQKKKDSLEEKQALQSPDAQVIGSQS